MDSSWLTTACYAVKVWGVAPISLVEAERNGATLVQNLAEMETSSSGDKHDSAVKELSDSHKKKANGHKEEGTFHPFCPRHAIQILVFMFLKGVIFGPEAVTCCSVLTAALCASVHASVSARGRCVTPLWLDYRLGPCCPAEAVIPTVCLSASLPAFVVL